VTRGDFDGNGAEDLRIVGTPARQNLDLALVEPFVRLSLDCNGDGDYTDPADLRAEYPAAIETLDIQLKGRDNVVVQQGATTAGRRYSFLLSLTGGASSFAFAAPPVATTISGTSWVFDVAGSGGDDHLRFDLGGGTIGASHFQIRGDLGGGNDRLELRLPVILLQSVLDVDVALGAGTNTLTIEGGLGRSDRSRVTIDVEGGDAARSVDTVVSGFGRAGVFGTTGRLAVRAALRAGNDRFTAEEPRLGTSSDYRTSVAGGPGNDVLRSGRLDPNPSANDGFIEHVLHGGPGADVLAVDGHTEGAGTYRVRLDGGEQADAVLGSVHAEDVGFGLNRLDVLVRGGRGPDVVYQAVFEPGAAVYAPLGTALMDGGPDAEDDCVFFGNGQGQRFGCESGS
jgi:hypothetical protein